ncbi:MAG: hypothetical protein AB8G23_24810 [Myxococcota bacterium]
MLPTDYALDGQAIEGVDADGGQAFRYRNSSIDAGNADAAAALRKATQAIEEDLSRPQEEAEIFERVVVGAGDVLFANNRFALHGREKLYEDEDGEEAGGSRWLLRTYGYKGRTEGYADESSAFRMLP